jgi:hypothetical protein
MFLHGIVTVFFRLADILVCVQAVVDMDDSNVIKYTNVWNLVISRSGALKFDRVVANVALCEH